MDPSKAKKAKATAKSRKKQSNPHLAALAHERQQRQQQAGFATGVTGNITPEITAPQIALQTPTVNPYHMMGAMAPNYYNPGNVVGGGYNL